MSFVSLKTKFRKTLHKHNNDFSSVRLVDGFSTRMKSAVDASLKRFGRATCPQ